MSELSDHYIGAKIMLPRGDSMVRGHVVAPRHDSNVNILGRAQAKFILDTKMYQLEFPGGVVAELTDNIIAESMCTQCDADGSEYLLLDSLVNTDKDDKSISLSEQQSSVEKTSNP